MHSIAKFCLAILIFSAFLSVSQAVTPGWYVGAGLGLNRLDTANHYSFSQHQGQGLGAKAYLGYNFNHYLGLEVGAEKYAKSKYYGRLNNARTSLEYSTSAIDLVLKAYLPLGQGFQIYGLGGVAEVNNAMEFNSGDIPILGEYIAPSQKKRIHKVRPIFGVGVSYAIPKSHVTTSLEWTRTQGMGKLNSAIKALPPANSIAVTFTYNFD